MNILSPTAASPSAALPELPDSDHALNAANLPTSFGLFKPVGHVMVGLPTQKHIDKLVASLLGAGWTDGAVLHFTPRESAAELETMVDNAGAMAGFGYEITMLRRYLALAQQGYRWLLVKVNDSEHAATVAASARSCGAVLAVHYRRFTVEELL